MYRRKNEEFLTLINILSDGQYILDLNAHLSWRSSSNQVVHFLTPRHLPEPSLFTQPQRDVEIHLRQNEVLRVKVPPQQFSNHFKAARLDISSSI